jgi:hypothetical protein
MGFRSLDPAFFSGRRKPLTGVVQQHGTVSVCPILSCDVILGAILLAKQTSVLMRYRGYPPKPLCFSSPSFPERGEEGDRGGDETFKSSVRTEML